MSSMSRESHGFLRGFARPRKMAPSEFVWGLVWSKTSQQVQATYAVPITAQLGIMSDGSEAAMAVATNTAKRNIFGWLSRLWTKATYGVWQAWAKQQFQDVPSDKQSSNQLDTSSPEKKDRINPHVKFCVVQLDMRLVRDQLVRDEWCEMSGVRWVVWDELWEMSGVRWVVWDEGCELVVWDEGCEVSGVRWVVWVSGVRWVVWDEWCEMSCVQWMVWDELCAMNGVGWVVWDEWCEMSCVRWVVWDEGCEMSGVR